MSNQQSEKTERLEALAHKLAKIIHEDEQENGTLKPSYRSPKFWVYVQREMDKLESESS